MSKRAERAVALAIGALTVLNALAKADQLGPRSAKIGVAIDALLAALTVVEDA
jgi:hypothetical protein